MNKTSIEWCDLSSNPLKFRDAETNQIVWGCVKVSPGCLHCYSETLALRYKRGKLFNAANMRELRPFMCEDELKEIRTKKKVGGVEVSGKRCFVGDMTDLFGDWVTDGILDSLFRAMIDRKDVTFQLLTKRSERMRKYFADRWGTFGGKEYPPPSNIWAGVSAENQARADERLPSLLATPAAVRFASFEPLLGDIRVFDPSNPYPIQNPIGPRVGSGLLDWAICGGESGPLARPMHPSWARNLRDQCQLAGVPFFFKQWGEWQNGSSLHGKTEIVMSNGEHGRVPSDFKPEAIAKWSELSPVSMAKVGKKAAGRFLDAYLWNEFPKVKL